MPERYVPQGGAGVHVPEEYSIGRYQARDTTMPWMFGAELAKGIFLNL